MNKKVEFVPREGNKAMRMVTPKNIEYWRVKFQRYCKRTRKKDNDKNFNQWMKSHGKV